MSEPTLFNFTSCRAIHNVQFCTKCAVLIQKCAVLTTNLCR